MSALDAVFQSFDVKSLFFFVVTLAACSGLYTVWDNMGKDSADSQQNATKRVLGTVKVVILMFFLSAWYTINVYNGSYSFALSVLPNLVGLAVFAGLFPSMLQAWIIFDEEYYGQYSMREYGVALLDVFMTSIGLAIQAGVEPAGFFTYVYTNPAEGFFNIVLSFAGNFLVESLVLHRLRLNSMSEAERKKFKEVPKKKRRTSTP